MTSSCEFYILFADDTIESPGEAVVGEIYQRLSGAPGVGQFVVGEIELGVSVLVEELLSNLVDQLHVGTTETIDALFGVAHPVALLHQVGEALENLQLYGTGVLELVDHHQLIGTSDFLNNLRHAE